MFKINGLADDDNLDQHTRMISPHGLGFRAPLVGWQLDQIDDACLWLNPIAGILVRSFTLRISIDL